MNIVNNLLKFFSKSIPLVISVGFAFLMFLLYTSTTVLDGLENMSLNFRFAMRNPELNSKSVELGITTQEKNPLASEDIVILTIDEETVRYFGEGGITWPYPWEVHSTFVDFVSSGDPNSILIDIMFLDHKQGESILADSLKKSGRVFTNYPFEEVEYKKKFEDYDERLALMNQETLPVPQNGSLPDLFNEINPPTPLIISSAAGVGFANVFSDGDEVVRRSPLVINYKDQYYPSITLRVVMNYYGITANDVEINPGNYIRLQNIPNDRQKGNLKSDSITIPIDANGQMYINYVGIHGSFQSFPYFYFYSDGTLEGNDSLKDKILLTGIYSIKGVAKDEKMTPLGPMFGIEKLAHEINTIINQSFLMEMNSSLLLMILFALGILYGLVFSRIPILLSTLVTIALTAVSIVGSHILFSEYNYITAYATPAIYLVVNYIFITTYRIFSEQREKLYIRRTFSKFVSKGVVDELLKHPEKIKLGGEKKQLTVLFSDIRGFTSISEQLTPEELVEHLNIYLQGMTNIVIKTDGTLDKYIGDAIMAFWGAPVPQEDHALRACKACIEMMEILEDMNAVWKEEGKPPLDIGIGLNSGDMVVGNMGSAARMDYTLMGDNVNLGSRLEGTNKVYGTHIIISEYTYDLVADNVYARELDLIKVKGKELPVRIYELMGIKD
jgi:adenylate cyclase